MSVIESCDATSQLEPMVSRLETMLAKLIGSQANLVESHKKLVESQERTQKQILDILRRKGGEADHDDIEKKDEEEHTLAQLGKIKGKEKIVLLDPKPSSSDLHQQHVSEEITRVDDKQEHQLRQLRRLTRQPTKLNRKHTLEGGELTSKFILEGREILYYAAASGNWEMVKGIYASRPQAISKAITTDSHTALHIAVMNTHLKFVTEILKLMPENTFKCRTSESGYTPLHTAALYGHCEAARMIAIPERYYLAQIPDNQGRVPLALAVQSDSAGKHEVIEFLYSVTRNEDPYPFSGPAGAELLYRTIDANLFGMALSIIQRYRLLEMIAGMSMEDFFALIELMAKKPFVFLSAAKLAWWKRCIYSLIQVEKRVWGAVNRDEENVYGGSSQGNRSGCLREGMKKLILLHIMLYLLRVPCIKQLHDQKMMHKQALELVETMLERLQHYLQYEALVVYRMEIWEMVPTVLMTAIKNGTLEVIKVCLLNFPDLIRHEVDGKSIIQMAITERNEIILDLILEACRKDERDDLVCTTDGQGNTLLHYAARLSSCTQLASASVPALQMQRQLQWFKGVENIIKRKYKFNRNKDGDTAHSIFTREHKILLEKGEKWMKDTTGSCMVVAALIVTIAFAAIFTVPGGNIADNNNEKNGRPVYLGKPSFTVFAMADAIALFSSITSVLMFLGIYASPYEEKDFFKSLPNKFILGLGTLFVALVTILIAFSAALFIVLGDKFPWVLIPITVFSCIPLILFAWLQLPLFVAVIRSTYWGGVFQKHKYSENENKAYKKKDI